MVAVNRVMKTVAEKLANTLSDKKEAIDNLQNQLLAQWKQLGVPSIGGGLSIEARARSLADRLYANNITDISKLRLGSKEIEETVDVGEGLTQVQKTPREFLQYDGRQIGFLGNADDGGRNADPTGYLQPGGLASWTAAGKGAVGYTAKAAPNGQVYFIPSWGSTSDLSSVAPILGLGLMFVPGLQGVGASIGAALAPAAGAAVQAGIGNAIVQGVMSEATGGDFLKGAALSGIGSGIGSATAPVTAGISEAVGSQALGQALAGGAMAELQGGDFVQGALQGAVTGVINEAANQIKAYSAYTPNADGSYTYTWDDGSTITIDDSANVLGYTPSTDIFNTPNVAAQAQQDVSGKLAALNVAKALTPYALTALLSKSAYDQATKDEQGNYQYPIVPVPTDWQSPQYNMAFTPSAPIDFGGPELLRGTQWENPINLSGLINTLNQPMIDPQTQQMMTQFQAPEMPYETGITDIIGEIGGQPVSIADIISGIQSGQNYSS